MDKGERGWALVSVLWAVAVLAMLAAAAQSLSFATAQQEHRALEATTIDAAFDAATVRAVLGIADARPDKRWREDGGGETFAFDGYQMHIMIQDELGRIDLNAADGSLIAQLLQSAGLSRDDAATLTDRILNWRSADTGLTRLKGGGDDLYARAGLQYRPRHGAFQSVDELKLVLGMTPALFARIRPGLTVYSHHPALDTTVAPREALLAYFPNQPERVAEILKSRAGALGRSPASDGLIAASDNLAGRTFDIAADLTRDGRTLHRETVVMLTADKERPFLTLAWR